MNTITLPSGKEIMINFPEETPMHVINHQLFGKGIIETRDLPKSIVIGKCNNCGSELTINDLIK